MKNEDYQRIFDHVVNETELYLVVLRYHVTYNLKRNKYISENQEMLLKNVDFFTRYVSDKKRVVNGVLKGPETDVDSWYDGIYEIYETASAIKDLEVELKKLEK